MTQLADGAVELPRAHLSVRVPWHDTDWTGRVCEAPSANHSCTVLKNIKQNKNADWEDEDHGKRWAELVRKRVPPCVFERAGFMRPRGLSIVREHAYSGGWTRSHKHFAPTNHVMPAYSVEATPYRWVMRDEVPELARLWGIEYDRDLEDAADQYIETRKPTDWVQDHRNQLALLDSFFSGVVPGRSLVLLYAKDVPLLEERRPGARVLIGAGRVTGVRPYVEWEYSGRGPVRSIMWERSVCHSIRPTLEDGFLLPYQQLLADEGMRGEDLSRFVAMAPAEHFEEFSYVSERAGDDAAIAALTELARVVDLLPEVVDGPWQRVSAWIGDRLAETWEARGPFPGLGTALTAAGLDRGAVIAHRVVESLDDAGANPWPAVERAIDQARGGTGPAAGLVGRTSRMLWERVLGKPEHYELLRLLSRFSLTAAQARRAFEPKSRAADVLENPYLIYELDREAVQPASFTIVDRGLFTQSAAARAALRTDPLREPVEEPYDDRRVRAASIAVLESAAESGHTLLDEPGLRKRLAKLDLDPLCDPTNDQFELAAEGFVPSTRERPLARRGRGWQLERLARATDLIASEVAHRLEAGPLASKGQWRAAIDAAIGQPMPDHGDPEYQIEESARSEKARALETLATSRIAALVGPAGTGKTTMLKALCSDRELAGNVLLLAPTGKARVQLADKVGAKARTLAGFLREAKRWTWDHGYFLNPEGMRYGGYRTVIVDEASMLTEAMLAALIESLKVPDRLILCGDHRQLPPIGAGRPFADLVAHLRAHDGAGLGELTVGRRQTGAAGGRDDLAVAARFAMDATPAGADQALARVVAGRGDGTIRVATWNDEDELHDRVVEVLCADPKLGLSARDGDALKRSLGAYGEHNGRPSFDFGSGGAGAERWQLLSPVRSRPGGVSGLNRLVRRTWRRGETARARDAEDFPSPMGADEILAYDKVMCVDNHDRGARRPPDRTDLDGEVANGEIGMAVGWPKRNGRPLGLWVEFSTQPGLQFTFWANELNGDSEGGDELLEIAYAITVHKSQGSQFELTFLVIPKPCPLLSPELLYTALTRHRERTVLLVQGDPLELLALADPARSETARRLTCLFRPADPFTTPDGTVLDGSHVHRSQNEELMRSKSEVIVANTLRGLGVAYEYELKLEMSDGTVREPDFTIERPGEPTMYWEHLGMLDLHGYRADWEAKLEWYREHGIAPWEEGGGPAGVLVWSSEAAGGHIDSHAIEQFARRVLELETTSGQDHGTVERDPVRNS
jgi:hypothetical protein